MNQRQVLSILALLLLVAPALTAAAWVETSREEKAQIVSRTLEVTRYDIHQQRALKQFPETVQRVGTMVPALQDEAVVEVVREVLADFSARSRKIVSKGGVHPGYIVQVRDWLGTPSSQLMGTLELQIADLFEGFNWQDPPIHADGIAKLAERYVAASNLEYRVARLSRQLSHAITYLVERADPWLVGRPLRYYQMNHRSGYVDTVMAGEQLTILVADVMSRHQEEDLQEMLLFLEAEPAQNILSGVSVGTNGVFDEAIEAAAAAVTKISYSNRADPFPELSVESLLAEARDIANMPYRPHLSDRVGRLLLSAHEKEPDNVEILTELGLHANKRAFIHGPAPGYIVNGYGKEELATAQAYLDQAIAKDAGFADAYVYRGHVAYCQNRFEEAKADYDMAQKLESRNPWLAINIADLFNALGDFSLAQAKYEEVIERQQKNKIQVALARTRLEGLGQKIERELAPSQILIEKARRALWAGDQSRSLESLNEISKNYRGALYAQLYALNHVRIAANLGDSVKQQAQKQHHLDKVASSIPQPEVLFRSLAQHLDDPTDEIVLLMEAGYDIHRASGPGQSVLALLLVDEKYRAAEAAIRLGADLNKSTEDTGPVIYQVLISRNLDVIRFVLEHGADTSIPSSYGRQFNELAASYDGEFGIGLRELISEFQGDDQPGHIWTPPD